MIPLCNRFQGSFIGRRYESSARFPFAEKVFLIDLAGRMGYWIDLDSAYITYKNEYIESVWWAIKTVST